MGTDLEYSVTLYFPLTSSTVSNSSQTLPFLEFNLPTASIPIGEASSIIRHLALGNKDGYFSTPADHLHEGAHPQKDGGQIKALRMGTATTKYDFCRGRDMVQY